MLRQVLIFTLLLSVLGVAPSYALTCSESCVITTLSYKYHAQTSGSYYSHVPSTNFDSSCSAPGAATQTANYAPPNNETWEGVQFRKYYWNGTSWAYIGTLSGGYVGAPDFEAWLSTNPVRTSTTAITTYQADQSYLNANYPGGCADLPPTCPNPEAEAAFLSTCANGLGNYVCSEPSDSTCTNGPLTCSSLTADCIRACGGMDAIAAFSCTETPSTGPSVTQECTCNAPTCQNELVLCLSKCGGSSGVKNYACDDTNGVTAPCECIADSTPKYEDGEPVNPPVPKDDPVAPDPVDPDKTAYDPNIPHVIEAQNQTNKILSTGLNEVNSNVQGLGSKIDNLGGKIDANGKAIVDAIKSQVIESGGTVAEVPQPTYDTEIADAPEEWSISEYFSRSAVPSSLYDMMTSHVTIGSSSSSLLGDVNFPSPINKTAHIDIDFSRFESWFDWAGNLLYYLCSCLALFLAFRKN